MTAPVPDVTVVVAVYNTMPYLTECLTSLVEQTIGLERLEVVAVDDGSTDGSPTELRRFAEAHPGVFTVVRQENSGTPAGPKNRALSLARGRYVFFADADDYLGVEALERLVDAADRLEADVMIGRMVGENDRYVHQALYRDRRPDVTLEDSALPWTLSNTKLFRRSLIEECHLRFPEDLPVGSDQPFTIEACLRASRISVLDSDYPCYHAVRRTDGQSITYSSPPARRLACTQQIMDHVADLVAPGTLRDAILVRHFNWELAKLVDEQFLAADPQLRTELTRGVAAMMDRYWTDEIAVRTPVRRRVRLLLAQAGDLDRLAAAAPDVVGPVPVVVSDQGAFLAYPGFRDPGSPLADSAYELHGEDVSALLPPGLRLGEVRLQRAGLRGGSLEVRLLAEVRATEGGLVPVKVALAERRMPASSDEAGARRLPEDREVDSAPVSVRVPHGDGGPSEITASFDLRDLVTRGDGRLWGVRAYPVLAGRTYEVPVAGPPEPVSRTVWVGLRAYRVLARANDKGRLVVRVTRRRTGLRWRRGESNP